MQQRASSAAEAVNSNASQQQARCPRGEQREKANAYESGRVTLPPLPPLPPPEGQPNATTKSLPPPPPSKVETAGQQQQQSDCPSNKQSHSTSDTNSQSEENEALGSPAQQRFSHSADDVTSPAPSNRHSQHPLLSPPSSASLLPQTPLTGLQQKNKSQSTSSLSELCDQKENEANDQRQKQQHQNEQTDDIEIITSTRPIPQEYISRIKEIKQKKSSTLRLIKSVSMQKELYPEYITKWLETATSSAQSLPYDLKVIPFLLFFFSSLLFFLYSHFILFFKLNL